MSRITILADNQMVSIDDHSLDGLDLELDAAIHAVQFDDQTNTGWIEYKDGRRNQAITNLDDFADALEIYHVTRNYIEAEQATAAQALQDYMNGFDYIRDLRNQKLTESDWTQMLDSPLTPEQRTAWAEYRQDLRDVPQSFEDPADVVWPEKPSL
jgi:hypothetical protein